MEFERGKDLKGSIGIGIAEKIKEDCQNFIIERRWAVCRPSLRKGFEKQLETKYGIHIGLSIEDFKGESAKLAIYSHKIMKEPIRLDISEESKKYKKVRRSIYGTDDTGPK